MPSITFDKFDVGLDRRKGASVSDANRLRELKNAYVTNGRAIRKRPGLSLVTTLETGTKGLINGNGVLNTFYKYSATPIVHSDTRFIANPLIHTATPGAYGSGSLSAIDYGEVFSGYLYVAATYSDGATFHYYIDSTVAQNRITDTNCPNSKVCIKLAEKIFAIDQVNNIVKYSDVSAPKVWDPAAVGSDAGSLPTGLRSRGSAKPVGLGQYQEKMAVLMSDGIQIWAVDPNPTMDALYKLVDGVGTTQAPSVREFAGDLVFKAKPGFRSITQQAYTENMSEVDIGSAIDSVISDYAAYSGPIAEYYPGQGQLWQMFYKAGSDSVAFVYTFSRTQKIAAWSQYTFGVPITDMATLDGDFYLRSGDDVYLLDDTAFTDNGTPYEMLVEMPFLDFKSPGILKHIQAMDLVVSGTVNVQFRYDPNDTTKLTDPITITGDTRSRQLIPIEMTVTSLAPVFTSTTNEDVQIDALTFYYENLGPF